MQPHPHIPPSFFLLALFFRLLHTFSLPGFGLGCWDNVAQCCAHPTESGWTPIQNLAWMSRLVMPHTHQDDMRRFITHIMRFSGESRIGFLIWPQNASREGKETHLGFYCGQKVGLGWGSGFVWFKLLACASRPSHQFTQCGAEGEEGGLRLKSCQQTNVKKQESILLHSQVGVDS